jgi:hypothetical protein
LRIRQGNFRSRVQKDIAHGSRDFTNRFIRFWDWLRCGFLDPYVDFRSTKASCKAEAGWDWPEAIGNIVSGLSATSAISPLQADKRTLGVLDSTIPIYE